MADREFLEGLFAQISAIADEQDLPVVAACSIDGEVVATVERGLANRGTGAPNTVDTVFGVASVTKGVTALVVMSLVEEGVLDLDAPVRRWLGEDLPLIDTAVTVDHLLTHTSGIGDYLDEDALDDDNAYVIPVPLHRLDSAEGYLDVLDGFPQVSPPGEQFTYNNGGFVVAAIVAERASGQSYHRLASERVLEPAGMNDSAFHRTDELPAEVAVGYLDRTGLRTNVLHLPVIGVGDGGLYSTVADIDRLWRAMFAGRIVSLDAVELMVERVTAPTDDHYGYGRGVWFVPDSQGVMLVGADAGMCAKSVHDPATSTTATVVSNATAAAWPVTRQLNDIVAS